MREAIVSQMLARRASAIVRTSDQRLAADAMQAAISGGFRLVEFTLTTPGAFELISDFARDARLLVGAGTVLTVADAERAVAAGAKFLVSAVMDAEVIAAARRLDVPSLPGCFTATEMYAAHRAGADFCKLFPAPADIPAYVRSMLAPLPMLRIFPTNGVHAHNTREVLAAGAAAVGFTTSLFEPVAMQQRDFAAIQKRAAELMRVVTSAGSGEM